MIENRKGAFKMSFMEMMKGVCTMIPGHVISFAAEAQRAQVRPGVSTVTINGATINPPPISDVPVLFIGGTQFVVTHQINPADEGVIVFSQRCVDGWKQTGRIANNPLTRFHDMQDAFFIPGFRPLPTRITGFQNDGIRLQSRDGSRHVWIKSNGDIVSSNGAGSVLIDSSGNITASNSAASVVISASGQAVMQNAAGSIQLLPDGSVNINGFVINADGTFSFGSAISAPDIIVDGISVKDHVHTGVTTGGDTSGGMTN